MKNKILEKADKIINGDRKETYGSATESFTRIAKLWSAYMGVDFDAEDVAIMMILMKASRAKGKYHEDNFVDMIGYAALADQVAKKND